jgi:hypothetical protein
LFVLTAAQDIVGEGAIFMRVATRAPANFTCGRRDERAANVPQASRSGNESPNEPTSSVMRVTLREKGIADLGSEPNIGQEPSSIADSA